MARKFNPFRPNSVVRPGMFVGRYGEIDYIENCLFQTKHGNPGHFLIEGERGIGKSSLLVFVEAVADGRVETRDDVRLSFLVANVELRDSDDYLSIVESILSEIKRQIARREQFKEWARSALEFLGSFEIAGFKYNRSQQLPDRSKALDDLTDTLVAVCGNREFDLDGVLILIDEADKPTSSANLGEMIKLLSERLSRRDCEKVSLGLAGLPGVLERLRDSHESSARVMSVLSLEPLELKERMELIDRGLAEANNKNQQETTATDSAKVTIGELCEGYPHFLQEFAYWAFEADKDDNIVPNDVWQGALQENGAMHQLGRKYFDNLYISQIGSDNYRHVLRIMARHHDQWVSRAEIIAETNLSKTTVDNALRTLTGKQIIFRNPAIAGEYRLPTKSFAIWIRLQDRADEAGSENGEEERLPGL